MTTKKAMPRRPIRRFFLRAGCVCPGFSKVAFFMACFCFRASARGTDLHPSSHLPTGKSLSPQRCRASNSSWAMQQDVTIMREHTGGRLCTVCGHFSSSPLSNGGTPIPRASRPRWRFTRSFHWRLSSSSQSALPACFSSGYSGAKYHHGCSRTGGVARGHSW